MKTLKLMMLFMAVATMPLLTSCGDDNKDTPTDVTGTYTGTITALTVASPAEAVVAKTGDNYSLSLEDLNISAMGAVIEIGDVIIPNVTITNGVLSGGTSQDMEITLPDIFAGMPGVPDDLKITLTVSLVNGTVSGKNLKFKLNITNVPVMQSVPVDFDGNKP